MGLFKKLKGLLDKDEPTEKTTDRTEQVAASAPRYFGLRVAEPCPACRHKVPINGPTQWIHCDNCQKDTNLEGDFWYSLLGIADKMRKSFPKGEWGTSGDSELGLIDPACAKCDQLFPVESIVVGTADDQSCASCGAAITTFAPPAWFKTQVPTATQIYGAERLPEKPQPSQPTEVKPVMFNCPNCGGALKITAQDKRTISCEFCDTEVYLPDPVWLRLHPVREVTSWFVRLEGEPPPDDDDWDEDE